MSLLDCMHAMAELLGESSAVFECSYNIDNDYALVKADDGRHFEITKEGVTEL